ncbi:pancreatic triacylglycerol lipase [Trichonephila clavata]|uniref:Pancreatic triacylglycerol lipase n=1 Tax=Trichonephila clavata TaxID=2740835 RepID=A0A8X6F0D5_TRICU|nr:pancreatic triacylglycerol lipase [Trichonephila clavata]
MKTQVVFNICWLVAVVVVGVESRNVWNNNSVLQKTELNGLLKKDEVCMKELGCFKITSDFISVLHRPINVVPHDRVTINTRFLLYTRKHPKESDPLIATDPNTIKKSTLNPKNPTKFIVHGFMDSEIFGPWMVEMKDEFLMHGDYNIIIVDWSGGNKMPYYQATANTRVVGAEIDLLIKALEKHASMKRSEMHIIGHSLGAHIAGYAGERLKTLGRITGCDPAEPYFENMPTTVRLDPTDATFVDVIHSDAASKIRFIGFGMNQLVGHVDFFPNNGRRQPGCTKEKFLTFITDGLKEGLRRFGSCNHQRALDFFTSSINYRKIVPVGYQCSTWEDFIAGKCTECGKDMKMCAIMGMRADEYKPYIGKGTQNPFYLQTSGKIPYWQYHYQISIKLYKPAIFKDASGKIDVTLFGSKNDELFHVQDKAVDLIHGSRYQYLVTTDKDLGDIKSVSMQWFVQTLNPIKIIFKPTLYVEYITVVPINTVEKSPRKLTGRAFCGNPKTAIKSKSTVTFLPKNTCVK